MRPASQHNYYVYILTNWDGKRMYVGMTNDLERRMYEHKKHSVPGFTQKYNIDRLVHIEHYFESTRLLRVKRKLKAGGGKRKMRLFNLQILNGWIWLQIGFSSFCHSERMRGIFSG